MVQAVQVAAGIGRALGDTGQAGQGVAWNLVWVTQRPAGKRKEARALHGDGELAFGLMECEEDCSSQQGCHEQGPQDKLNEGTSGLPPPPPPRHPVSPRVGHVTLETWTGTL